MVPGRPTTLNKSRARAFCACEQRVLVGVVCAFFFSSVVSLFFLFFSGRRPDMD